MVSFKAKKSFIQPIGFPSVARYIKVRTSQSASDIELYKTLSAVMASFAKNSEGRIQFIDHEKEVVETDFIYNKKSVAEVVFKPGVLYDINFNGSNYSYSLLDEMVRPESERHILSVTMSTPKGVVPLPVNNPTSIRGQFGLRYPVTIFNILNHAGHAVDFCKMSPYDGRHQVLPHPGPRPTEEDRTLDKAYEHFYYAFHTSNFVAESTPKNVQKLHEPRIVVEKVDMNKYTVAYSFLLDQIGYYNNRFPEYRQSQPKNYYYFLKELYQCSFTTVTSAGIVTPLVQEGGEVSREEFKVPLGHDKVWSFKKDSSGRFVMENGPKAHFMVHIYKLIEHILDNFSVSELDLDNLLLKVPQVFNVSEKMESRRAYEDTQSCRLFYISPLFMNVITRVPYHGFALAIKKNLPFFQGFSWDRGAASDIFENFNYSLKTWASQCGHLNLPMEDLMQHDMISADIKRQDQSYLSDVIYFMQIFIFHFSKRSFMEDKIEMSYKDLLAEFSAREITDAMKELDAVWNSEDDFNTKWWKLQNYVYHSASMPVVNYPAIGKQFLLLRLLASGLLVTGSGNTMNTAIGMVYALKEINRRIVEEEYGCTPKEKEGLSKAFGLFIDVVQKHPNIVCMGDNILGFIPKIFRRFCFPAGYDLDDPKWPLEDHAFHICLTELGFKTKREESYMVFDHRLRPVHSPSFPVNGVASVSSFCSRFFMVLTSNHQDFRDIQRYPIGGPTFPGQVVVPYRYPTDYISKLSPFAHPDDLVTYYLKSVSLIRDNYAITKKSHEFLVVVSRMVKSLLVKNYPHFEDDLEAFVTKAPTSAKLQLLKNLGHWNAEEEDIIALLPLVGRIPSVYYLHSLLFMRDEIVYRRNIERKLDPEILSPKDVERAISIDAFDFLDAMNRKENNQYDENKFFVFDG